MFTGREVEVPAGGWRNAGCIPNHRPDRFGVAWRCLDAQFTRTRRFPYAVPQRRRRIFIVGYFGDWRRAAEVLLEPSRLSWNPPTRVRLRESVAANSERGAGETGRTTFWNGADIAERITCTSDRHAQIIITYENHGQDSRVKELKGVSPQLNAKSGTGGNNLPLVQRVFVKTARPTFKGGCETYADKGVAPTVNSFDGGDKRANELICCDTTVRRITPIECERLMGFPDDWTRIPWRNKEKENCPDGPRYKACGNSMCVNVMEWIGEQINRVEKEDK
jgi:DNA (cytosine-5)-methyltransferase 1